MSATFWTNWCFLLLFFLPNLHRNTNRLQCLGVPRLILQISSKDKCLYIVYGWGDIVFLWKHCFHSAIKPIGTLAWPICLLIRFALQYHLHINRISIQFLFYRSLYSQFAFLWSATELTVQVNIWVLHASVQWPKSIRYFMMVWFMVLVWTSAFQRKECRSVCTVCKDPLIGNARHIWV